MKRIPLPAAQRILAAKRMKRVMMPELTRRADDARCQWGIRRNRLTTRVTIVSGMTKPSMVDE